VNCSDLVARVTAGAQPSAEDQRDDRILVTIDAEQREETGVPCGDVPQLAPDCKSQFVVFEVLDPVGREHERIRLAESERCNRDVVVFAYEDQRHRDVELRARRLDDVKDARILLLVNHHRRADQPSPRECDVEHRDHDEERDLGWPDALVNHEPDQRRDRERKEQGEDEG